MSPSFEMADEGAGKRPLPDIKGHPELAAHMAESLINDEFDMTLFQERALDHGCNSPLSLMWPHEPEWPGAIVPIEINVLQYPLPRTAAPRPDRSGASCHTPILSSARARYRYHQ